jgi:uncharacterized protein involved in outer membrane biogenesis
MPPRRRRSFQRALLLRRFFSLVVLLGVLALIGGAAAALVFDPNSLKPALVAAAEHATGHRLEIIGRLRLHLWPPLRLTTEDVVLGPVEGTSAPDIATVHSLSAQVAVMPLLSGELRLLRLDLWQPQVLLATDAAGHGNWQPAPRPAGGAPAQPAAAPAQAQPAPAETPPAPAAAPGKPSRWRVSVGSVRLHEGRLVWQDARSGRSMTVGLPLLEAVATDLHASLVLSGSLTSEGHAFTLSGEAGPLARLLDRAATTPYPIEAVLQGDAARLAVRGVVTQPLRGAGYALQVDAAVTDFTPFAPLLPAWLPPLRDASLSARVTDGRGAWPDISAATLHLGGLQLPKAVPGLAIGRADLSVPNLGAPVRAELQGTMHGAPLHLAGTFGPVPLLTGGNPAAPVPVRATIEFGGSQLAAEVVFTPTTRPSIQGAISAQLIELDPLLAALAPPGPAVPPPPPPPATPPAPPRPARPPHVIPDDPIDLGALDRADADLQLAASTLTAGGLTYRNVSGHLIVHEGNLALDPFGADVPGGRLEVKLALDPHAADAPASLVLRAPALALQPLAAAFGRPELISGSGYVDADLRGHGRSPHAIAATLDGRLGLAASDAEMDNIVLASAFAGVLRAAKLPETVFGPAGRTKVRCLALRVVAHGGLAEATTLVADASRMVLQGNGSADLGNETLNLHLRPLLRLGPGVTVPVYVSGSFAAPRMSLEGGAKGGLPTALVGALATALGQAPGPDQTVGDVCPGALAAARGEAPAPAPAAAQAPASAPGAPDAGASKPANVPPSLPRP